MVWAAVLRGEHLRNDPDVDGQAATQANVGSNVVGGVEPGSDRAAAAAGAARRGLASAVAAWLAVGEAARRRRRLETRAAGRARAARAVRAWVVWRRQTETRGRNARRCGVAVARTKLRALRAALRVWRAELDMRRLRLRAAVKAERRYGMSLLDRAWIAWSNVSFAAAASAAPQAAAPFAAPVNVATVPTVTVPLVKAKPQKASPLPAAPGSLPEAQDAGECDLKASTIVSGAETRAAHSTDESCLSSGTSLHPVRAIFHSIGSSTSQRAPYVAIEAGRRSGPSLDAFVAARHEALDRAMDRLVGRRRAAWSITAWRAGVENRRWCECETGSKILWSGRPKSVGSQKLALKHL